MAFEKLRLLLALLWWRFCRFLVDFLHVRSLRPADEFLHKVVIIGDDFAAGVGDYVTMGSAAGLAQHLKPLVKQSDKVRPTRKTRNCSCAERPSLDEYVSCHRHQVRHNWEIVNAGVPGSRSADWKMNASTQVMNGSLLVPSMDEPRRSH